MAAVKDARVSGTTRIGTVGRALASGPRIAVPVARPAAPVARPAAPAPRMPAPATAPLRDGFRTSAAVARLAATAAIAVPAPKVPAPAKAPAAPARPAARPAEPQRDGGFWSSVKSAAKAAGKAAVGAAKAVGNAVVGTAKAVGNAVVGTAKAVGNAVVGAGKTVWSWTKSTGDNILAWGTRQVGKVAGFFGANLIKREPGTLWTRRIERDPADSNATGPLAWAKAKLYLATHKGEAKAARSRLNEADRARYDRVFAAAGGDPVAQAQLQKWLIAGKLPGAAARGGDRGNLLAQLDKLATQPLAPGVSRRALVADTIQEIADPACINQHKKGTCVATVAAILLAKSDPAEYARLIGGLASPEGTVKTAKGHTLVRESDWNVGDGGRSVTGRLLFPALMEFGNGKLEYDNATDKHSNGKSGLNVYESERILDSVTGKNYTSVLVEGEDISSAELDAAFADLKKALDEGQKVPCGLAWVKGGHKILAERVEDGRVYYTNPWGKEESLSVDEFKARLRNYNVAA